MAEEESSNPLSAGANLLGGGIGAVVGGLFGASSAKKQRAFNAREAKRSRRWQEKMYDTRYIRTTKDMRAAGINPLLAYRQGTGGGVPSGAQASASLGQEASAIAQGAGKGIEAMLAMATKSKIQQDTATSAAQQAKLIKETTLLSKQEPWALIMEQIADQGVKPFIDFILEKYNTGRKTRDGDTLFNNLFKDSVLPPFPDGVLHRPKGKSR